MFFGSVQFFDTTVQFFDTFVMEFVPAYGYDLFPKSIRAFGKELAISNN